MGLEKVKQEIVGKAQSEASSIIEEAKKEARTILSAAEKRVKEKEQLMKDEADISVISMKKKELASAELEVQKKVLVAKSDLIERVFTEVGKKLGSISGTRRESHIKALLDLAKEEIEIAVVNCNSKDTTILKKLGEFEVVENDEISGGLIAETADNRLRVDYSYETLIEQVRSKVLSDVARTLFGN
jgi:V/A-type H+/Na+-transporting ATPase subunit E